MLSALFDKSFGIVLLNHLTIYFRKFGTWLKNKQTRSFLRFTHKYVRTFLRYAFSPLSWYVNIKRLDNSFNNLAKTNAYTASILSNTHSENMMFRNLVLSEKI